MTNLEKLSLGEQGIVLQCMKTLSATEIIDEYDSEIRLGVSKQQLEHLINLWPRLQDATINYPLEAVIQNCLGEMAHGINWAEIPTQLRPQITKEDIAGVLRKWIESQKAPATESAD